MQLGEMEFQPMIRLTFTKYDVEVLMALSSTHYDEICRELSCIGGRVYGMDQEIQVLGTVTVERLMKFRDIDLLCKLTEFPGRVLGHFFSPEAGRADVVNLHAMLQQALAQLNKNFEMEFIDFVCTDFPGPGYECVFVELENPKQEGMSIGEWVRRADGYAALRISKKSLSGVFGFDDGTKNTVDPVDPDVVER